MIRFGILMFMGAVIWTAGWLLFAHGYDGHLSFPFNSGSEDGRNLFFTYWLVWVLFCIIVTAED
jgi:hypothetical protein